MGTFLFNAVTILTNAATSTKNPETPGLLHSNGINIWFWKKRNTQLLKPISRSKTRENKRVSTPASNLQQTKERHVLWFNTQDSHAHA